MTSRTLTWHRTTPTRDGSPVSAMHSPMMKQNDTTSQLTQQMKILLGFPTSCLGQMGRISQLSTIKIRMEKELLWPTRNISRSLLSSRLFIAFQVVTNKTEFTSIRRRQKMQSMTMLILLLGEVLCLMWRLGAMHITSPTSTLNIESHTQVEIKNSIQSGQAILLNHLYRVWLGKP